MPSQSDLVKVDTRNEESPLDVETTEKSDSTTVNKPPDGGF